MIKTGNMPGWTKEAPIKLTKSLLNFFRDHEIPQIVILELGSEGLCKENPSHHRFICNSMILALHSGKFERVISAGSQVIFLEGFNYEAGVDTVRLCIEFLHGEDSAISQCDDSLGILRFAESWEIPCLWHACLDKMKTEIVTSSIKLLDYLRPSFDLAKIAKYSPHMNEIVQKVVGSNADLIIKGILSLDTQSIAFNDKIFLKLIEGSKPATCGQFLIWLLAGGQESRTFVAENLHSVPDDAFTDEVTFVKFKSLLLDKQCDSLNRSVQSKSYDKFTTHSDEFPKKLCGPFKEEKLINIKCDDNASIMQRALDMGSSSSKSPNDLRDGFKKKHKKSKERTKLMINCEYAVKDYPAKIKNVSLYSGLEIIAQMVSMKKKLSLKNLVNLLSPYFRNPSVAACILEDLHHIALTICCDKSNSKVLNETFAKVITDRVETFSVSKSYNNASKFIDKLKSDGRISLHLDHGLWCQIKRDNSVGSKTTENDSSKKPPELLNFILKNLDIDLSSASINFISEEEIPKDYIIHCYIVGLSSKKTPVSYVSILQLTIPEIVEKIKGKVSGVKIVVVFSRNVPACSSVFSGKLV